MNTKIFICCHKDYDDVGLKNNSDYILISDHQIKNNSQLELLLTDGLLDDKLYCELNKHYYVWKNLSQNYEYIGMCHYRRYFDFMDDIPNNPELILPTPINQPYNNAIMYGIYHNIEDITNIATLINKKYPKYFPWFNAMLDSHYIILYNMFVLKKDYYNEYMNFLFNVLFDYMNILKINNNVKTGQEYILTKSQLYLKTFYPNNTVDYQLRSIFGGLGERISTAFFMYLISEKKIKPTYTNIKITDHTYNTF